MKRGTWVKGKKSLTGYWDYNWAAQRFHVCIELRRPDYISGESERCFDVYDDKPNFNGWVLQRTQAEPKSEAAVADGVRS